MSGAYCRFCDHRCFVLRVVPAGPHSGWSGHMATCTRGKQHDREALGYDADTSVNPAVSRVAPASRPFAALMLAARGVDR